MRYVTAVIGSLFMFLAVTLLSGLLLMFVLPRDWAEIEVIVGPTSGNLVSIIAFTFGGIAATHTFRASLKARTGRLYRTGRSDNKQQASTDTKGHVEES
jgi:hypothetical protein